MKNMIRVTNEKLLTSLPLVAESGQYQRVLSGEITTEECNILDNSSPELEIMTCDIPNINNDILSIGFYKVKRSNSNIETWHYNGPSRVDKNIRVFTRPLATK